MHVAEHAFDVDLRLRRVEVIEHGVQRDLERVDAELELSSHFVDELQLDTSPEVVV